MPALLDRGAVVEHVVTGLRDSHLPQIGDVAPVVAQNPRAALSAPRLASQNATRSARRRAPWPVRGTVSNKLHVGQRPTFTEAAPAAVVVDVAKSNPFGVPRPGYIGLVEDVVHGALVVSKGLRPFHEMLRQGCDVGARVEARRPRQSEAPQRSALHSGKLPRDATRSKPVSHEEASLRNTASVSAMGRCTTPAADRTPSSCATPRRSRAASCRLRRRARSRNLSPGIRGPPWFGTKTHSIFFWRRTSAIVVSRQPMIYLQAVASIRDEPVHQQLEVRVASHHERHGAIRLLVSRLLEQGDLRAVRQAGARRVMRRRLARGRCFQWCLAGPRRPRQPSRA